MNGSEMLLNSAEQYGLLVALSSNGSNSEESVVRQSRLNIGNTYKHNCYYILDNSSCMCLVSSMTSDPSFTSEKGWPARLSMIYK